MRQTLSFTFIMLLASSMLFLHVASNNAIKGRLTSYELQSATMLFKGNALTKEIIPEFDPIGPLCLYSIPPALPDTSLNGVTGTWEPPAINTDMPGNFTYTFTPDPGQNAVEVMMVIAILPEITPLFGPIGAICQYSAPAHLPDTSLNGITGTWNPPIINTDVPGVFTFTFTPDAGPCAITLTMDIEIYAVPVVDAGPDQAIPHGTSAILQGSAGAGSGIYIYHWEPASKLINPDISSPYTVNLYETTLFTLNVTDAQTGCECSRADTVAIIINGSALSVNPTAYPDYICQGETVQLFALAGGGTGIYSYNWTSIPSGFTSTLENPIVTPFVITAFQVSVSDGYNMATGSTVVTVNQNPVVDLGEDISVCVSDTVILSAGNPGSTFIWSTGSTEQSVKVFADNAAYDMQTISVTVMSPHGCTANDECIIVFDIAACSGIDDPDAESGFNNYPNPFSDFTIIEFKLESSVPVNLAIFNAIGQQVALLVDEKQAAGKHQVRWDAKGVPEGVYFCRLTAGKQSSVGKMAVVR